VHLHAGGQALNERAHDRLGLSVFIAREGSEMANAFNQGRHVDLSMFIAEHHQIAFPVTESVAVCDL
jgi:hypothetical protein